MRGSRAKGGSGPRTSTVNPTHESARGSRGSRGSRWSRDSSRSAPTSLGAALLVDAVGETEQPAPADTAFDVERGGERRDKRGKSSSTAAILSGKVRVVSSSGTSASSGSGGRDGRKPRRRDEDTERHRRGAPGPGHSLVWQWPECSERRCECAENALLLLLLLTVFGWWFSALLERQQAGHNETRTG